MQGALVQKLKNNSLYLCFLIIFIGTITILLVSCASSSPLPRVESTPIQPTTPLATPMVSSATQQTTQQPTSVLTADSAPSRPIKVRLSLSEAPVLNRPVELTAFYSIMIPRAPDLPDTSFEITLPDQFELINGTLKQIADLNIGQTVQQRVIIRSIKFGRNLKIEGRAYFPKLQGYGGSAYLYVIVSENGAIVRDTVFTPDIGPGTFPSPTARPTTK
jgi:hypothetical protein